MDDDVYASDDEVACGFFNTTRPCKTCGAEANGECEICGVPLCDSECGDNEAHTAVCSLFDDEKSDIVGITFNQTEIAKVLSIGGTITKDSTTGRILVTEKMVTREMKKSDMGYHGLEFLLRSHNVVFAPARDIFAPKAPAGGSVFGKIATTLRRGYERARRVVPSHVETFVTRARDNSWKTYVVLIGHAPPLAYDETTGSRYRSVTWPEGYKKALEILSDPHGVTQISLSLIQQLSKQSPVDARTMIMTLGTDMRQSVQQKQQQQQPPAIPVRQQHEMVNACI